MNELEKYFRNNNSRLFTKWNHYFDVYDRHFSRYRNKPVVILEVGVFHGGSLQMWKHYFGPQALIFGIDINPKCKEFEEENIKIFIGSQSDRSFLQKIKSEIPPIDILIDDGGHYMDQQIITFDELYGAVKEDGIYLCEDLHTSYWLKYGGGYNRKGTFIEFSKQLIDSLNAFHSEQKSLPVSSFTKQTDSIHYYDSIIVIEKRRRAEPVNEKSGNLSYQPPTKALSKSELFRKKIKRKLTVNFNRICRLLDIPSRGW